MSERMVSTNGVELRIIEEGSGPLVILCHGFPDLAFGWRHQIPALAAAGYRVVAPDQRGYGGSSRPEPVEDYDMVHLTDDMIGLLDELGEEQATFVGHDWGSMVVWSLALRAPERVAGVVGTSVPFLPHPDRSSIESMRFLFADSFFYMLYFQDPGVADADLGADPARTMRGMYAGLTSDPGSLTSPEALAADGRGFVERLHQPGDLPGWLSQSELDHYAATFSETGYTGALNWYRNMDRNWHLMEPFHGAKVTVPARFVGGTADPVLTLTPPSTQDGWLDDDRGTVLIEAAGHWVQQERPDEVNAAILDFLAGLEER